LQIFAVNNVAPALDRRRHDDRVILPRLVFRSDSQRCQKERWGRFDGEDRAKDGDQILLGFGKSHRGRKSSQGEVEELSNDLIADDPLAGIHCASNQLRGFRSFCRHARVEGVHENIGVGEESTAPSSLLAYKDRILGSDRFEPSHESVYGGTLTRPQGILFQPFAKSSVKDGAAPSGNQPSVRDEMLVSAEGDVFHTKTVHTVFVRITTMDAT
jgi:hypothetical protein